MLSRTLPPSTQAGGAVAPVRERLVPPAWPGVHVPNFSDWQEGDIVRVHRVADAIGYAIQASQAASLSPVTRADSICSHAAVYVGAGRVVDATRLAGVSARSVWSYCQFRTLRVRRVANPLIPKADVADIAALALQHVGEPYSVLQALISKVSSGSVPVVDALHCSTLVGLVVADATGIDLSSYPAHQPLHPGTLAAHPDLVDVLLEW